MYQASADFLSELKQNARFEHIRGTIGATSFDDSNIISMSFSNCCSSSKDVSFGMAYVGQLKCVLTDLSITRGSYKGLPITIEFGLTLPDESIEYIPVGTFYVAEALWTDTGINITANDAMAKFDKLFTSSQTSGEVYDLLALACESCGVTLGVTKAQCEAMPNGYEQLGIYPNNDIKTYRDLIGWVAQTVGGFATIDRSGHLVVRSWANSSVVDTFTPSDRIAGSAFSDYETLYGGVSIVNIDSKSTTYYGNYSGSTINLGSNPLLQFGAEEVKTRQRMALATVAQGITWTPYSVSIISNLVYDLGDLIEMTGGVAGTDTLTCCVMSIEWSVKELTTLQGYGADPSLASGKSRTDKELSGLMSSVSENEMIIYSFINAEEYELEDETETDVCEIHFATKSPKTVNLWHEIKLDIEADDPTQPVTCTAHYYLNDEELSYSPVTSWDNDGEHLLHLLYFLESLGDNTMYDWRVALEIGNGTATIDRGDIHAVLQAQGLVATDEWAGLVPIKDPTYYLVLGGELRYNYEEGTVETQDYLEPTDPDWDGTHTLVRLPTITDASYVLTLGGELTYNYEEGRVDADTFNVPTGIITENGDALASESDEWFITE